MAFVKSVEEQYPSKGDVRKLAHYIADPMKCKSMIDGGKNIFIESFLCNPDVIAEQFLAVQHGQSFKRRLYHVIISFEHILDQVNIRQAYYIGQAVCNMYPEYQSAFSIHENTETLHIHIMFNNCPIMPNRPKLTDVFNLLSIQEKVEFMIDHNLGII